MRFTDFLQQYENTGPVNDRIHIEFTNATDRHAFLKRHRDFVEANRLGFGDRAFHYMWLLTLDDLRDRVRNPSLLEIGVYKGQIISLWALIMGELGISGRITCITPLEGQVPKNRLVNNRPLQFFRALLSPKFRRARSEGNLYESCDYESAIRFLFSEFGIDFDSIRLIRGYSNDPKVLDAVSTESFDVIYIDGDHSFEGARRDIEHYSRLVAAGGFLVIDDASFFLDGSVFWKGHEAVSKACKGIEKLGFTNILNVGHNRIYRKDGPSAV